MTAACWIPNNWPSWPSGRWTARRRAGAWCRWWGGRARALSYKEAAEALGSLPRPRGAWKPLFDALRRGVVEREREDDRDVYGRAGRPWPADRQIVYVVDVPAPMKGRGP